VRRQDWPLRLEEEIEKARSRKFSWGTHDCALWTAGVVAAITGVDYASAWRGQYTSEFGALKAIAKNGYEGLDEVVTKALGEPVNTLTAQRGDVVLFDGALGVCTGSSAAFVTVDDGLTFVPIKQCSMAWSVK
jgi:hypothetical protein